MKTPVLFCLLVALVIAEKVSAQQTTRVPATTTTKGIVQNLITISDRIACLFGICPSTPASTPAPTVKAVPTTVAPTTVKAAPPAPTAQPAPTTVKPAVAQTTVQNVPTTVKAQPAVSTAKPALPTTVAPAAPTTQPAPTTVKPAVAQTTVQNVPTTVKVQPAVSTAKPALPTTVAPAAPTTQQIPTTVKLVPTTVSQTTALPTIKPVPTTARPVPPVVTSKPVTVAETTVAPTTMSPIRPIAPSKPAFIESNDTVSQMLITNFDCRRVGHDCYPDGGMCDLDSGLCVCHENFTGFTCADSLDFLVNVTQCNYGEGCGDEAEAVCYLHLYSDMLLPQCSCPYHMYGDKCELPRYELRCSEDFMTINANPYLWNWKAIVYVIDYEQSTRIDNPECSFLAGEDPTSPMSLKITYADAAAKCGAHAPDNTSTAVRFIVQSDQDWLTSFDQVITATCSLAITQEFQKTIVVEAAVTAGALGAPTPGGALGPPPPVGAHVSNDLGNIGVGLVQAERRRVEVFTITPHPIINLEQEIMVDETVTTVPITGSVKIGDVIVFNIESVNDTFYMRLRAEECSLKMDDLMTASLLKEACPASRLAWSLFEWKKIALSSDPVSAKYYLRLPANALAGQPRQITITCRVKLCAEDVTDQCDLPEGYCDNAISNLFAQRSPGYQGQRPMRRRRSAEPTAYAYVQRSFELDYSEARAQSAGSSASTVQVSFAIIALLIAKWFL